MPGGSIPVYEKKVFIEYVQLWQYNKVIANKAQRPFMKKNKVGEKEAEKEAEVKALRLFYSKVCKMRI